jgi:hypothetical protein
VSLEKDLLDDEDLEEMSIRFLNAIENATSKELASSSFAKTISELTDVDFAKNVLRILDNTSKCECGLEKQEVIKGIIQLTWLQRIHSIIRSLLLGLIAAIILIPVLLIVGSLNIVQNVVLAIPIFLCGLVVTRLLDEQTIKMAKKTVKYLSNHKKIRNFMMDYI